MVMSYGPCHDIELHNNDNITYIAHGSESMQIKSTISKNRGNNTRPRDKVLRYLQ